MSGVWVLEGCGRLGLIVFVNMFMTVHVPVMFVNVSGMSMPMRASMQMRGHACTRRPGRKLPP